MRIKSISRRDEMADIKDALELSGVIAGLRAELEKAQKKGKGKGISFGVEGIEVEIDVSVAKSIKGTAEAGVTMTADNMSLLKYVVGTVEGKFSINGEGSYEKVANQKVKLILSAKDKDGNSTNLNKKTTKKPAKSKEKRISED